MADRVIAGQDRVQATTRAIHDDGLQNSESQSHFMLEPVTDATNGGYRIAGTDSVVIVRGR